jgi:S1-C subfamily serine protease
VFPKLPDWAIYAAAVAAIAMVAVGQRENLAAPPAPPPPDAEEGALIGSSLPFDPPSVVAAPSGPLRPLAGTAFSVSTSGRWLTARHVVGGCRRAALLLGGGHAIPARVMTWRNSDVALLVSRGGPTALPMAFNAPLEVGQQAWIPGYPQGRPGEVAVRLLGPAVLRGEGRGAPDQPVLAWAEVGRTEEMKGTLSGLSGAPALDSTGRVLGVVLAERPRRGLIYTSAPTAVAGPLKALGPITELAVGAAIGAENYGRIGDDLRRDLRVARVMCLTS